MRAQPKASHWIGGQPVEDAAGEAIDVVYPPDQTRRAAAAAAILAAPPMDVPEPAELRAELDTLRAGR